MQTDEKNRISTKVLKLTSAFRGDYDAGLKGRTWALKEDKPTNTQLTELCKELSIHDINKYGSPGFICAALSRVPVDNNLIKCVKILLKKRKQSEVDLKKEFFFSYHDETPIFSMMNFPTRSFNSSLNTILDLNIEHYTKLLDHKDNNSINALHKAAEAINEDENSWKNMITLIEKGVDTNLCAKYDNNTSARYKYNPIDVVLRELSKAENDSYNVIFKPEDSTGEDTRELSKQEREEKYKKLGDLSKKLTAKHINVLKAWISHINEQKDWILSFTQDNAETYAKALRAIKKYDDTWLEDRDNVDLYAKDKDGNSAVHLAVQYQSIKMIKCLLESTNIGINTQDNKGNTALHLAVKKENIETIKCLLESTSICINPQDNKGNTALHLAVKKENIGTIKCLLESKDIDINLKNTKGKTTLHLAAKAKAKKCEEMVDLLLTKSENMEMINAVDREGNTALHLAVKEENIEMITCLLEAEHIDITAKNVNGETALHLVAKAGGKKCKEMVVLLTKSENIKMIDDVDQDGNTALYLADRHHNQEAKKALLAKTSPADG